jgi:hypothetical protein
VDVENTGIDVDVAKANDRLADLLASGLVRTHQHPHDQSNQEHGRACYESDGG